MVSKIGGKRISPVQREEIRTVLNRILKSPSMHSKWLNTLSLMEHIGSRKIHASQTGHAISEMVLRHASEEARHAAFFKKLALQVRPEGSENYDEASLLAGTSAVFYFQRLDSIVNRELSSDEIPGDLRKFLCYLYVTKLIEERAGIVYEEYESCLRESGNGISLKTILKEEENHLREMNRHLEEQDPDFHRRTEKFREKEAGLFAKFFVSVQEKTA
ncbi:hypothetical protein EHO60_13805 [Leptospira fletcheri]|uniref:Rubrerythrin n=1 Tax=Leptospira fletcheri TaxID=2484981 RepID=A0A4R9GCB8_9LEPT|nr:hypothetical protein [Leptospira fletcheri]TGK08657.1 hypothetical protein EHO60_13805 [Leptospira fletcheri]